MRFVEAFALADYAAGSLLLNSLWSCNETTVSRWQRTASSYALYRFSIRRGVQLSRCYRAGNCQQLSLQFKQGPPPTASARARHKLVGWLQSDVQATDGLSLVKHILVLTADLLHLA